MFKLQSSVIGAAVLALVASAAGAQTTYPERAITLVVPYTAGSQPDILARALADGMAKQLGQSIVIQNRDGASGMIAVESVARASADGYTVGFGPQGQFTVQPHLRKDMRYSMDDFTFVCRTNTSNFVLVAGPNSPFNSLDDLIAAARKSPGKLTFASGGQATGPHLIAESLALEADVKFTHVPFRNVGNMYAQTIAGEVDFLVTTPTILGMHEGIKTLAVIGDQPLSTHPKLPLMKDLGYPKVSFPGIVGLYANKDIPAPARNALEGACEQAAKSDLFVQTSNKLATPVWYENSAKYTEVMRQDSDTMRGLLKTLGIEAQ